MIVGKGVESALFSLVPMTLLNRQVKVVVPVYFARPGWVAARPNSARRLRTARNILSDIPVVEKGPTLFEV
jgi:hypothetical protein